jgi:hypothetical protein
MVQRLSAILYLPNERQYSVDSNHSDMVKFDSSRDRTFQTVVTNMKECLGVCSIVLLVELNSGTDKKTCNRPALQGKTH